MNFGGGANNLSFGTANLFTEFQKTLNTFN